MSNFFKIMIGIFMSLLIFMVSESWAIMAVNSLTDKKENKEKITNETIITLVKSGLSDNAIISLINQSRRKFDLSPQSLVKLKQAGVSNAVIEVMLNVRGVPSISTELSHIRSTMEPFPTTYGFYIVDEKRIHELKPVQVITKIGLGANLGKEGGGYAVDGLTGEPSLNIKNQLTSFIVYKQNLNIDTLHLSRLVYTSKMQAYQFNIRNTDRKFFRSIYNLNYNDKIPINLWRPGSDIQFRTEPISEKPDMYRLIPESTLMPGKYTLYFAGNLHKNGMIFATLPNRHATAFYFNILENRKGKKVFEKVIAAMGDAGKIKNIKNVSYKFDFIQVTPTGETKMGADLVVEYPDKTRFSIMTPEGQFTMIINGKKGWIKPPAGNIMPMPVAQRKSQMSSIQRDPFYIIQNLDQYKIHLIGEKKFAGTNAIGILLTGPAEFQLFINPKTNLPLGAKFKQVIQNRPSEIEETVSDYKDVEGIKIPFNTIGKANDKKSAEFIIKEIKFNIKIEKDFFKGK